MPRTLQQILDHANELAEQFELTDPAGPLVDATALRALRAVVKARADAEQSVTEAVAAARQDGHPWSAIGAMLGTSGEAARQRYGHQEHSQRPARERSKR